MKELYAILRQAPAVVNDSVSEINRGECGLKEAEERIVNLVNRIGGILVDEVLAAVEEPTEANTVRLEGGERARYKGSECMQLRTRFGTMVRRSRRRYAKEGGGTLYPLDQRLGLTLCGGYTPLMTYLVTLFGAGEAYEPAAERLSEALARKSQCAVEGALFPVGANPTRHLSLRPVALGAVQGGNELD